MCDAGMGLRHAASSAVVSRRWRAARLPLARVLGTRLRVPQARTSRPPVIPLGTINHEENAMGASIDVSAATEYLAALTGAITLIGAAKLGPAGLSVAFKWVKGAIFS